MKNIGIVAEYNPFHNGHKYQLEKIREELNPDNIIIVMSQDIVQRGEFASFDKYWRAKTALENGADLVVGLPFFISSQSAGYYADGSVKLLNSIGIDTLVFGAESDSLSELDKLSKILIQNEDNLLIQTKKLQQSGLSYPKAREIALKQIGIDNSLISDPNNILALEYLKTINKNQFDISPYLIQRIGSHYNSYDFNSTIPSASAIRNRLSFYKDLPEKNVPYPVEEVIEEFKYVNQEEVFKSIYLKLLNSNINALTEIVGINEDRANQLINSTSKSDNFKEFILNLKSKNITRTSINRIIIALLLDFKKRDLEIFNSTSFTNYHRILGFNNKGREILRNPNLTILSNLGRDQKKLNDYQKKSLNYDLKAASLRRLFQNLGSNYNDYLKKPLKM